jgi:hypothetical protein
MVDISIKSIGYTPPVGSMRDRPNGFGVSGLRTLSMLQTVEKDVEECKSIRSGFTIQWISKLLRTLSWFEFGD